MPLPRKHRHRSYTGVRSRIKEGLDPSDLAGGLAEMILPGYPRILLSPRVPGGISPDYYQFMRSAVSPEKNLSPEVPGSFTDRLEFAAREV